MNLGASIFRVKPQPLGTVPDMPLTLDWRRRCHAYPLLSWFSHISVHLEKGSDVERLTSPDIAMDAPIQG